MPRVHYKVIHRLYSFCAQVYFGILKAIYEEPLRQGGLAPFLLNKNGYWRLLTKS